MKFFRYFKYFIFILTFIFLSTYSLTIVSGDLNCEAPSSVPIGDMQHCIDLLGQKINALMPAQENNKKELAGLNSQFASLQKQITAISSQLDDVANQIAGREEDLAFAQKILDEKALNQYIEARLHDPILSLLSAPDASEAFRRIKFLEKVADADRKTIEEYAEDLHNLKKDKGALEKNKVSLAAVQAKVNDRAKFLTGEVAKVENYLTELSSKQQELLTAKSGAFVASVGDSDLADDYKASIKGFREAAPSGSFAVFSFGAYTHRKGMSQYGARGRAENHQDYKTILRAYYGKEPVNKDTGGSISVAGYGNLDFETAYLYGIAEMPSAWNIEALKAQAVAARTYAYRFKQNGTTICTSEDCQVFSQSKSANPPDSWKQAVESTRGQVLEDVVTFYSSTSGGYLTTMGWDTTDGGGGSNFLDKTYEKLGGSPWVYKAWYRKGYSNTGDTCGRNDPWLTNEELSDIVNAALVLKNGKDDRITSVSTSCWGGNPYTYAELRQKGGVDSVSNIYVSQGSGITNEVVVNGTHLTGDEFKQAFNLRAPGYLMIPQKGFAFFNIEKK